VHRKNLTGEQRQVILFKLADKLYAVDIGQVREITKISEISPMPNSPNGVLGVTSLRGHVAAVLDLRAKLGLPAKSSDRLSRMLIVESKGVSAAVVVDSVEAITMLAKAEIEAPPPILKGSAESCCILGIGKQSDKLIIIIDLHRLLDIEGTQSDCAI
jgi:purine-binding chemotaxis protein CheW